MRKANGLLMVHETSRAIVVIYIVAMVIVIVGMDFAIFRHRFLERLLANLGLVLLFAAFYLRFLRPPS